MRLVAPSRALPGWVAIHPAARSPPSPHPLAYFFVIALGRSGPTMRPDHTLAIIWRSDATAMLGNTLLIAAVIALLTTTIASASPSRSVSTGRFAIAAVRDPAPCSAIVKIYAWKSILGRDGT
jgi:ABC-type spermidine/putrescine transport system permease subunit I